MAPAPKVSPDCPPCTHAPVPKEPRPLSLVARSAQMLEGAEKQGGPPRGRAFPGSRPATLRGLPPPARLRPELVVSTRTSPAVFRV